MVIVSSVVIQLGVSFGVTLQAVEVETVVDDQGRLAAAEPYYRQALELRENALPPEDPELVDALRGAKAVTVLERSDQTALTSLVTQAMFKARANADAEQYPHRLADDVEEERLAAAAECGMANSSSATTPPTTGCSPALPTSSRQRGTPRPSPPPGA